MPTHKLLLLPGDGIGPEVMAEVKRLIDWLNAEGIATFETEQGLVGGSAYDADKVAITDATMALAQARNPYSRWWLWIPGSRGACHRARIRATRWRAPE